VANKTTNSDATTGSADSSNELLAFTGLAFTDGGNFDITAITNSCRDAGGCDQAQNGSNTFRATQNADAHSGDGVVGQVNGVVAGGRTSLDANNSTTDSSADTGETTANNSAHEFTGLLDTSGGNFEIEAITGSCRGTGGCDQAQNGSNRGSLSQTANATSGDAVAGEVSGVVTSAGGSASVVVANTTTRTDTTTGSSDFNNVDRGFVGIGFTDGGNFDIRA